MTIGYVHALVSENPGNLSDCQTIDPRGVEEDRLAIGSHCLSLPSSLNDVEPIEQAGVERMVLNHPLLSFLNFDIHRPILS